MEITWLESIVLFWRYKLLISSISLWTSYIRRLSAGSEAACHRAPAANKPWTPKLPPAGADSTFSHSFLGLINLAVKATQKCTLFHLLRWMRGKNKVHGRASPNILGMCSWAYRIPRVHAYTHCVRPCYEAAWIMSDPLVCQEIDNYLPWPATFNERSNILRLLTLDCLQTVQ